MVELGATVDDHAGQQIEAPGGAFGIGDGADVPGQRERFHQRHQIDAALFQHGAAGQVHAMHLEIGQAVADLAPAPAQERGAQPPGAVAQPQIEAGGLDLFGQDRRLGRDGAIGDQLLQTGIGQDSVHAQPPRKRETPTLG